jgi:pectate lyase
MNDESRNRVFVLNDFVRCMTRRLMIAISLVSCCGVAHALDGPGKYLDRPDAWFASDEAKTVAENILSHQSPLGGWPKNLDTSAARYTGKPDAIAPTFDNRATTDELRVLARVFDATHDERYRKAFDAGLDYIFIAQYPTGGWPQSYPIRPTTYHRHITFNDDAMVRVLEFLKEIVDAPRYDFVGGVQRAKAEEAFDRGVQCILACQIRVDGKLTAWCAQHDEIDLSPRKARWHELPSISGAESLEIVRLLMSIDRPTPEIIASVDGAAAWFERSRIKGYRVVQHPEEQTPGKFREAVRDSAAPDLWARMYDIETNQPLVSGMDSVPHLGMAEIGYGRPGYQWFGSWPELLLAREYPAWKRRIAANE